MLRREHEEWASRPFIVARISRSPSLQRELRAAREWGQPRSVLLGRVVRPGEPLFTAEDTDYALWFSEWERSICSGCGLPLAESTDPDNEFEFTAEPVRCHGCYVKETASEHFADPVKNRRGLRFRVRR